MPPLPFHPLVRSWFAAVYGKATAVQEEAWPLIAAGENVLAIAPTGSGKTLTAFLAAISRFIDGTYDAATLAVLYVSPLKALNEDIRRNILEPLRSLKDHFARAGEAFPGIRVETRSGDTPESQRRRFLASPPSVLAVTPESLAILLLNPRGRETLSKVKYLIIDEIHSVLAGKRGAFLSCQIDRLSLAAGEFQRTALSATVRPEKAAAEFAGGLGRPVRIVSPPTEKKIELLVDFPPDPPDPPAPAGKNGAEPFHYGKRYAALAETVLERLGFDGERCRRTVLVFTDSRQRAERIALLINKRAQELAAQRPAPPEQIAFAHHGSLSREVRHAVEQRLAEGRLSCVAATGSLELGIDIGSVDEVILAGSPGSTAAALQRIGRSGHGVGRVSRGLLVPFHRMDLVTAAALCGAVEDREIEEAYPVENPLDILSQVILELCAEKNQDETWQADELYETLRGFYIFRTLPRASFDTVILMLSGYYGGNRIRELKGRIYFDRTDGEIRAADGLLRILYTSGGVIANRGYFSLRLEDGTKIGELDEEFVWERRIGDSFEFGSRPWTISAIGSEAVTVVPAERQSEFAPFYHAGAVFRSPVLSRRILELFSVFNNRNTVDFPSFSRAAAEELSAFIGDQLKAQEGVPLPDPRHIPVEIIDDPDRTDVYRIVFHSFRGGAINHPFALALSRHLEDSIGARVETRVETLADDNAVLLSLPRLAGEEPEKLISQSILAISGANGQTLFRRQLEASGLFGAEFREAAERSIVLVKTSFGKRTPLWFTRQRSRRLFDAVSGFNDFPLTAEAWRSCLKDRFDLPGFAALIKDIVSGTVTLSFFRTRLPTPFSREQIWKDTGAHMYEYDERPDLRTAGAAGRVTLADQIIKEALEKAGARPPLPAALQADFSARLRREVPGWAPSSALSLGEWVRERIAIPLDEWECLLAAIPEALREELRTDTTLDGRIARIKREGAETAAMVHRDIAESWEADAVRLLGPWLRFQGPVTPARIGAVFGTDPAETESAILALCESGELVRDVRVSKTKTSFVCDRENLEILLRLSRKKSRPQIAERPVSVLIPFLVRRQGILIRDRDGNDRHGVFIPEPAMPWGKLLGFAAHVPLWERDIFPCRTADYSPEKLDREIAMGYLFWYGAGNERAAFSYASTTDLVLPERNGEEDLPELFLAHRAFFERERDFWEIKEKLGLDTRSCAELIWRLAWQGLVSSDTWESVRRFIEHGAVPKSILEQMGSLSNMCGRDRKFGRRVPRAIRERRREGPPVPGRWFSLETDGGFGGPAGMDPRGMDPLDEENLNRQRIRLLLERWGVLARPLLERETSCFSWSKLLPAMRRMELAGELYSGRFFAGLNSLQFAAPGIEWELAAAEDERGIYRMNACDPASPAGLELEGLPYPLPSRLPGNRLCFRGASPAYVSTRNGREIKFFFSPEDPDAESITGLLVPPRKTAAASRKTVIEKINGVSAARSPYGEILKTLGFVPDRDKLILW